MIILHSKGRYLLKYVQWTANYAEEYLQFKDYGEKHHLKLAEEVHLDVILNELVSDDFDDFYLKMLIGIDEDG